MHNKFALLFVFKYVYTSSNVIIETHNKKVYQWSFWLLLLLHVLVRILCYLGIKSGNAATRLETLLNERTTSFVDQDRRGNWVVSVDFIGSYSNIWLHLANNNKIYVWTHFFLNIYTYRESLVYSRSLSSLNI